MRKLNNEKIILPILFACLLLAGGIYLGQRIKPRPPLSSEERWAAVEAEKKEILKTAESYLRTHGAPSARFDLRIVNQAENQVLLEAALAVPADSSAIAEITDETDNNIIILLEKMSGRWIGRAMGSTLPQWEERLPQLFNPPCQNLCGDGFCQEIVCQAVGCPCAENASSCSMDCEEESRDIQ